MLGPQLYERVFPAPLTNHSQMLRVVRIQSQRRLFRSLRSSNYYEVPFQVTWQQRVSGSDGWIKSRDTVGSSLHRLASYVSLSVLNPVLREIGRRNLSYLMGQRRVLNSVADTRVSARHNSYYAAEQYSDEDSEPEAFVDLEGWKRRLKRFRASAHQEFILKDRNDRRDAPYLEPLMKQVGLHCKLYNKTVVISKSPLPNYRPDLDDKRPQRMLAFNSSTLDRVEYLLQNHLAQKPFVGSPASNGNTFYEDCVSDHADDFKSHESKDSSSRVTGRENSVRDELLKKKSWRMKNLQKTWQESSEGLKMLEFRQTLPAHKEKEALLSLIARQQVLVVSGETGCGKTTQIPQYILESEIDANRGASCNIICTQPRRISAASVAERVATERGEELGQSVGYQVRLEGKRSSDTRLMFCTSGILLRRLMADQDLKGVSHVVVDEIHERGMNEDFLLIVLKNLLLRRPDLRLVLMSATLNAELFSSFFDGAPMAHIPGFTYPVQALFLEDVLEITQHQLTADNQIDDYGQDKRWKMQKQWQSKKKKNQVHTFADDAMADQDFMSYSYRIRDSLTCWNPESLGFNLIEVLLCHICKNEKAGAVLVFLTGWEDITAMMEKLGCHPLLGNSRKVLLLACHGSMATQEHRLIFDAPPAGVRKVVLATNMAETSITICDVVFVVDCGKAKETSYDALNNTPCLLSQWISRASAHQRRGRAGRVQPGVCYHLYPKLVYEALDEYQLPELLRTPLQALCLQIKSLQVGSIEKFLAKALQPPEPQAVVHAVKLLQTIGALDEQEELTYLGHHLAGLPVEPRIGKMLLMGSIFGCLDPILTIAATLTTRDPFLIPMERKELADKARFRFAGEDCSDHLALVHAFNGWKDAMKNGNAADYCWRNFLSLQTLHGVLSLRKQFLGILSGAGFAERDMDLCNQHSSDQDLVRGVICAGLFPGVAAVLQRSKSTTFKTKEDGQVLLHQNSVNSREAKLVYPWLIFNEKVKTSSVIIRDSTAITDSILLLFGGEIKQGKEPGQLLMHDGFLEFFVDPGTADMFVVLRKELDALLQRKLRDPQVDIYAEGEYLLQAVQELLHGDNCEGNFVYGMKGLPNISKQAQEQQDVKGLLQNFVQKGGKHPPPKYNTKSTKGGFVSTVFVRGTYFTGMPALNKKEAEKNVSVVALESLMQLRSKKVTTSWKNSEVDLLQQPPISVVPKATEVGEKPRKKNSDLDLRQQPPLSIAHKATEVREKLRKKKKLLKVG